MNLSALASWLGGLVSRAVDAVSDPFAGNFGGAGLGPLRERMGEVLAADVASNFAGSHAPDGTPWRPLKYRKGTPLVLTGALEASAVAMARAVEVSMTGGALEVALDTGHLVGYGLLHDRGAGHVPARPFVGVSEGAAAQLALLAADELGEQAIKVIVR